MPRASLVAGATIAASLVVASSAVAAVIARGALTPLNGERATGKVTLTQSADGRRVLRFANSSIGAGPRLHVYLVPGTINGNADVKVFKDLGPLHGTSGSQSYPIPRGIDVKRFHTVVIWCAEFHVAFGKALLQPT